MDKNAQIPNRLLRRVAHVCVELEDLQDELEDFLIAHNPQLLRKLRKARREDLSGKTRPFPALADSLSLH